MSLYVLIPELKTDEPRSQDGAPEARLQYLLCALQGAHCERGLRGRDCRRLQVPRLEGGIRNLGTVLDLIDCLTLVLPKWRCLRLSYSVIPSVDRGRSG